jgi:EmrB/QacA subfamily drug resistance transporter
MSRTRSPHDTHPTALLVIFCAAAFMTALDVFIVNVGLSEIGRDVGDRSLGSLSWILNAYAIVFAALLIPAGRIGDRYGNKQLFLAGLATFTLASLGCALSGNVWLIVSLRCVQAVGAAALGPTSVGLILTTMPVERRQHSVRIWSVSGSLGAAAGPALGGLLVALSWRWIFLINVPIGLLAFLAVLAFVPDVRHSVETLIPDLLGGALLIAAIGALALALVQGSDWGWGAGATLSCFVVSGLASILFVLRSARHAVPVIDLRIFRTGVFASASAAMFMLNVTYGVQLLGLILWLQQGWGWSALHTGLLIAPSPAVVSVAALGLRRFTTRLTPGLLAAFGCLLIGAGGALIGISIGSRPDYVEEVLPGWLLIGVGVGFAMPTMYALGTAGLEPRQTSTGSAVLQMARWIGSALGVALLVIVLGSSVVSATSLTRFSHALLWAGLIALLAGVAALGITPRRGAGGGAAATPVV